LFTASTQSLIKKHLPRLPKIICEDDLRRDLDELVAEVFAPMRLAIVDDRHTADALGDEVFRALKGRFPSTHVTLQSPLIADDKAVASLRAQTLSADALIAVGSGTVNDLCKYVAHLDRQPYLVFPTAASMNGYLSANASITVGGHKKTMLAMMPQAVFCDLSVITEAPLRLSQSGFGDALARSTAQADWLLSHLFFDTHYDDVPFELLAPYEPELMELGAGIAKHDKTSISLLIKTLLLSGMGMTIAGGSYPASQGEHMIAHTMEMLGHKKAKHPLHGEAIGVTTLLMAAMQQELLQGKISFRPDDFSTERMIHFFSSEVTTTCRKAFDGKMALVKIAAKPDWVSVAEKIAKITIPVERIKKALESADAPTHVSQLGWADADFANALSLARYTRERFTFLDLSQG
jgi:glycerol-1-phosphate dehydrogenase [NAD(P)+]